MASNSFTLVCAAIIMSTASSFVSQQIKSVYIQTNEPIYEVDDRLLSIALDTNLVRNRWHGFQLSERIITLCRGLQPAYLRIGGTAADFLIFDENALKQTTRADQDGLLYGKPIPKNFTITSSDLDLIHEIASKAGWDVVFDLNVLLRTVDGSWNSSNPLKIMHYASDKGYNFSWQLGNEPNHFGKFHRDITAAQIGQDFQELRRILDNYPSLETTIVGPDVDRVYEPKAQIYLKQFLASGGDVVDALTWHQYYVDGRTATIEDFYNSTVLDAMIGQLRDINDIVSTRSPSIKAWMGETASAWGGGAPGLSDRYVAGFMWLDKLGLAARLNHDVVIRQSFYGGRYGLLDQDLNPTPDYWLSALYKRLVGAKVLDVEESLEMGRLLRVYAHCTNTQLSNYNAGAVTIIAMNIDPSKNVTFRLTEDLQGLTVDQYLLTPSEGDLTSQFVLLNGQVLKLLDDKTLPNFNACQITSDHIVLPSLSMGFFVVPGANVVACQDTLIDA